MTSPSRPIGISWTAALFTFVALLTAAPMTVAQEADETVISQDTTWTGESKTVAGPLRVENGSKLTISGGDIRFGGRVLVETGAVLDLGPLAGSPAILSPASDASEFWIDVQGTLRSEGTDAAQVEGVWGQGLASVIDGRGGVQVSGTAALHGLVLRESTAGIVVHEGGNLAMRDAMLEATGQVGVAVMGQAELDDVSIRGNSLLGLTGRATCEIHARNVLVEAEADGVLVNSCDVSLDGSIVRGGGVAVTGTGSARVWVNETQLVGYRTDGASASPLPDRPAPRVFFRNVTLEGAEGARRGVEFTNVGEAVFDGVTVRGHQSHGLFLVSTDFAVRACSIQGNGGYGIFAIGGDVAVDLGTCDFGLDGEGTSNSRGAVYHMAVVQAYAQDAELGIMPGLNVTVRAGEEAGSPVVYEGWTNGTAPVASMSFETFEEQDGVVRFLGPFAFEAEHPAFTEGPRSGAVDLGQPLVFVVGHEHPAAGGGTNWVSVGFVMAGVGLLLVASVWSLVHVGWRKSRSSSRRNGSS